MDQKMIIEIQQWIAFLEGVQNKILDEEEILKVEQIRKEYSNYSFEQMRNVKSKIHNWQSDPDYRVKELRNYFKQLLEEVEIKIKKTKS